MDRIRTLLVSVALLSSSTSLAAQQTETEVRNNLEFARGLAADWGFTDLSEEILADLEGAAPASMTEELKLTRCRILVAGAKSSRGDSALRNELYGKALSEYEDFIGEYELSDYLPIAESEFVSATGEYAYYLELDIEEATGQEAQDLRELLQVSLTKAVDRTGDLIANLEDADEEIGETQKRQLYDLMLNRGRMLSTLGKSQTDGAFSFDQASQILEKLALDAGASTPDGLKAYIAMGENFMAQGEFRDASDFFTFVCDKAIPFDIKDRNDWLNGRMDGQDGPPSSGELESRFRMLQLGVPGTLEALSKAGSPDEAAQWGLMFYNVWRGEGLTLIPGRGHIALLSVGQAMLDAGGYVGGTINDGEGQWYPSFDEMKAEHSSRRNQRTAIDISLDIAQLVKREMAGNVLQIRAQKLIAELLDQPGVEINLQVLYDAAEAEYFVKNNNESIKAFKRLLAALDSEDQATKTEFGTRSLYRLATSYRNQARHMEAVVTYREALENWPADPEFSPYCAESMLRSAKVLARNAPQDQAFKALITEAETWVTQVGNDDSKCDIQFKTALREFEQAGSPSDYQRVMGLFGEVCAEAKEYEKTKVYPGVCAFKAKDFNLAENLFKEYLEVYVNDANNVLSSIGARTKRQEAMAMGTLYWGLTATAKAKTGGGEAEWRKVLTVLDGFEDKFKEQDNYSAVAMYRRAAAHLELGETDEAIATQSDLAARFPKESSTGKAADAIYISLTQQEKAATDPEQKRSLLVRMAELKNLSNSLTSKPQYQNLRNEAVHWRDLSEWEKAETACLRLLDVFGSDDAYADRMNKNVRPDLGLALMRQKKVTEAVEVLSPLKDSFTSGTARIYSQCLTGWAEYKDGEVVLTPGAGASESSFTEGTETLKKLLSSAAGKAKWEDPWYQAKLDLAVAYLNWSNLDDSKKQSAKGQLENLIPDLGSDFSAIENEGIRAQYQWLWSKVR